MSKLTPVNIAQVTTNESKIRLIALFVFTTTVLYILTKLIYIPLFLVLDFALRAFDFGKYSPLAILSESLVKTFKLPFKQVYLPPKRFAARIGLLFSVAILLLQLFDINNLAVSIILAFCAALESFLGFCAGCYVFSYLQKFKLIK